jgi:hypothetical protein
VEEINEFIEREDFDINIAKKEIITKNKALEKEKKLLAKAKKV